MLKITNYKLSSAQFEENAAHLERAQWILNQDKRLEGDDVREAMQEIGDVLENFGTIRERAAPQTETEIDVMCDVCGYKDIGTKNELSGFGWSFGIGEEFCPIHIY